MRGIISRDVQTCCLYWLQWNNFGFTRINGVCFSPLTVQWNEDEFRTNELGNNCFCTVKNSCISNIRYEKQILSTFCRKRISITALCTTSLTNHVNWNAEKADNYKHHFCIFELSRRVRRMARRSLTVKPRGTIKQLKNSIALPTNPKTVSPFGFKIKYSCPLLLSSSWILQRIVSVITHNITRTML